jgi:AP-2 complex subunit alpha
MTLGILLHENHELIPLIVNSCKVDLDSRNSMFQALALSAMANIGGKEMAESLAPTVLKLLTTNTTKAFVLKRAALCLLRLFRKHPDIIIADNVIPIIKTLLASTDCGVQTAAAGLLVGLATNNTEPYESLRLSTAQVRSLSCCSVKCVLVKTHTHTHTHTHLLQKALHTMVVKRDFKKQYLFYGVPSPWLQVSPHGAYAIRTFFHRGPRRSNCCDFIDFIRRPATTHLKSVSYRLLFD